MKLRLTDKYFQRLGHHYILLMMILTRICGLTGGLLVVFYAVLTLHMPDRIYLPLLHFRLYRLRRVVGPHRVDCAVGAAVRPPRSTPN